MSGLRDFNLIARIKQAFGRRKSEAENTVTVNESIANVDHNAKGRAAAVQSAKDAADMKAESPADEGGEG